MFECKGANRSRIFSLPSSLFSRKLFCVNGVFRQTKITVAEKHSAGVNCNSISSRRSWRPLDHDGIAVKTSTGLIGVVSRCKTIKGSSSSRRTSSSSFLGALKRKIQKERERERERENVEWYRVRTTSLYKSKSWVRTQAYGCWKQEAALVP